MFDRNQQIYMYICIYIYAVAVVRDMKHHYNKQCALPGRGSLDGPISASKVNDDAQRSRIQEYAPLSLEVGKSYDNCTHIISYP